jgi:hypothetical protein
MTSHRMIGVPEQSFAILSRYASGSQSDMNSAQAS